MKQYHPAAVAINRHGERTRYFLKDTAGIKKLGQPSAVPTVVLDSEGFASFVHEGLVQLFEDKGNGPVVSYNDEERSALRKVGVNQHLSEEEYWASEVKFFDEAVDMDNGISIGLVMMLKMKLLGQVIFQGCVYSKGMSDSLRGMLKGSAITITPMAADMVMCSWGSGALEEFLRKNQDVPITICLDTMKNLDSTVYKVPMPGFGPPSVDELVQAVRALEFAQPPAPVPTRATSGLTSMKLGG